MLCNSAYVYSTTYDPVPLEMHVGTANILYISTLMALVIYSVSTTVDVCYQSLVWYRSQYAASHLCATRVQYVASHLCAFLSIEFHCTFFISYKLLPYFVYYYCILVRM